MARSGGVGLDARDPLLWGPDLVQRGEQLGRRPHLVQERAAAIADDRIGKALADGVLLHLQVEPRDAHDCPLQRAAALAPSLESVVDLGEVRQDALAGRVHDVVRVALQQ